MVYLTRANSKQYNRPVTSSTKRGHSVNARREELDRAMRRPRRILWSYCLHHNGGYYFYGVSLQTANEAEQQRWNDNPDMVKVRATCMDCGKRSILFVGKDELTEHRYAPINLCLCGLPYYHQSPDPKFIQQYNAQSVVCRPHNNGSPSSPL